MSESKKSVEVASADAAATAAAEAGVGNAQDRGRLRAGDGAAVHPLYLIPNLLSRRAARSTSTGRPCSSPGSSPIAAPGAALRAAKRRGRAMRGPTSSSARRPWTSPSASSQSGIPYVAFGGGEPLAVPHCWEIFDLLAAAGVSLKIETDGTRIDDAAADRLAALAVQCVQISVDGANQHSPTSGYDPA